ncbi:MAG: hypothetical protein K8R63_11750 [Bacteroidales bacterium]|nr:hypothetical protein [Bacteroidales bacterium]
MNVIFLCYELVYKIHIFWILDTRYWILDTGYWILDTGYWIRSSECLVKWPVFPSPVPRT